MVLAPQVLGDSYQQCELACLIVSFLPGGLPDSLSSHGHILTGPDPLSRTTLERRLQNQDTKLSVFSNGRIVNLWDILSSELC
jgi:hypothetical protein